MIRGTAIEPIQGSVKSLIIVNNQASRRVKTDSNTWSYT